MSFWFPNKDTDKMTRKCNRMRRDQCIADLLKAAFWISLMALSMCDGK